MPLEQNWLAPRAADLASMARTFESNTNWKETVSTDVRVFREIYKIKLWNNLVTRMFVFDNYDLTLFLILRKIAVEPLLQVRSGQILILIPLWLVIGQEGRVHDDETWM